MKFTAIIEQGENGWLVGQIKEIPAALSQGKTIQELKANLLDALELILNFPANTPNLWHIALQR
jgi:predicted RNase H-like HicB family nuclease